MVMLLTLSLLGNVAIVALALWGWRTGGRNLAERLYVAPNRERRRTFFDCHPVEPGDVVFLGDSLVAGAQWNEIFPDAPVRNRGIGGDTTATLLERLHQVTAGRPARVLLMIGTNDLSIDVPQSRIIANYAAILDRLTAESPATSVVVQSVLPRGPAFIGRVRALNAALAELASARGCTFVDLTPAFAGANGAMARSLSNDELHLLGAGYVVWGRAIVPYVTA